MKAIKILHITTDSQIGGTEKMISAFIKHCSDDFCHVLVILKNPGPFSQLAKQENIPTYCLHITKPWHFWKFLRLFRIFRREKPFIAQSYLFHANIATRIIGRMAGVKHIISGQRNIDTWRRWYHILLDRITSPFAERIISNTEAGKKRLVEKEKINSKKILVVPNGIEKSSRNISDASKVFLKTHHIPEKHFLIAHAGSLTEKKAQADLIRSFLIVAEKRPDAHLFLAGDGPLKNKIENMTASSPFSERIHLLGFQKDIFPLLSASDIFVLPSLWEGMPNVILEAMSVGIPVIATQTGGISELIDEGENGLLVPVGDIQALGAKILFAIENPEKMRVMAEKAREKVLKNFTIERMVKSLESIYKEISNSKKNPKI